MKVFGDHKDNLARIQASEIEPSLQELLNRWLERTPGLESKGFHFWKMYKLAVDGTISSQRKELEVSFIPDVETRGSAHTRGGTRCNTHTRSGRW